jgi:hypothetical protein
VLTFIVFNLIHAHQIHPIPYLRAVCFVLGCIEIIYELGWALERNSKAQNARDEVKWVVATKADIVAGLELGLAFVQSSHAPSQERVWVDELITEGEAYGFWTFRAAGGTEMIRLVRKTGDRRKREPSKHVLDPLRAPLCGNSEEPTNKIPLWTDPLGSRTSTVS